MKFGLIPMICIAFSACTLAQTSNNSVSMVSVLTNPDAYHGKSIVTGGVLGFEDRGGGATAIYLTRDHFEAGDYNSAIFISFSQLFQKYPNAVDYYGQFVYAKGIFDAHSGTYPQFRELESIEPFEPLFETHSIE